MVRIDSELLRALRVFARDVGGGEPLKVDSTAQFWGLSFDTEPQYTSRVVLLREREKQYCVDDKLLLSNVCRQRLKVAFDVNVKPSVELYCEDFFLC